MKESKTEASAGVGLLAVAKVLTDLAAVWMVFGYLSTRAFCNFAGIPMGELGVEHYLEETYSLLFGIALDVFASSYCVLVVFAGILVALLLEWRRHRRRDAPAEMAEPGPGRESRLRVFVLLGAVLLTTFGFGMTNRYIAGLPDGVLLGKLDPAHLQDPDLAQFYETLGCALVGLWACLRLRPSGRSARAWGQWVLYGILCVFSALLIIHVPIVQGASLGDRTVYVVRLQLKDAPAPLCVARILESSDHLSYWSTVKGVGRLGDAPASRIQSVDYVATASLLRLAQEGAKSPAPQPQCETDIKGAAAL